MFLPLALTTDKLQLVTDSAATVDVIVAYTDSSSLTTPPTYTTGRQLTQISSATTTDILAAPALSTTTRVAKAFFIVNTHATTAVTATVLYNANGTTLRGRRETLLAGDQLDIVDGMDWFRSAASSSTILIRTLSADATGVDSLNAQPWFPSTGSATVAAGTTYWMQGRLVLTRAAGAVSHTTSLLFGGTATLTSIAATAWCNTGDVLTTLPSSETDIAVATAIAVKAASTSTTEAIEIAIDGIIRINAAGTLIPQFKFSAAPGGAPTVKANSYFLLTPWGSGSFTAQGPWA